MANNNNRTTIKLTTDVDIEVPSLPSFIKVNGQPTPIQSIKEETLKQLGDIWVKHLLHKAKTTKAAPILEIV